jgi:hypothetical protein
MGLEARARAHLDGTTRDGILLLETDELIFRGDDARRLRIPLSSIRALDAVRGLLSVVHAGGRAAFTVPTPERWAERIRSPKGRLDKLGIFKGTIVHVRGAAEPELLRELRDRGAELRTKLTAAVEVVVFFVPSQAALMALDAIRHATSDTVAIWAVWKKGQKELGEDHVRTAARSRDLVDVKVAKVSDVYSGLKLVVRRDKRDAGAPKRARPSARAKTIPPSALVPEREKPRASPHVPADLAAALSGSAPAKSRWEALPPSHKRRYLSWIDEAKRPETRKKRVSGAIIRLGG